MSRQERQMELIKILGEWLHRQFPNIEGNDPKVFADAYGKFYWKENFIRSGDAEWVQGNYGPVLKTCYFFFEDVPDKPAEPVEPPLYTTEPVIPRPEGEKAIQ